MANPSKPLLQVTDLTTVFHTPRETITAVDGVSFSLDAGKTICIVGESGCGKSVTALSIMRLITPPAGEITKGAIVFNGRDLTQLSEKEMRSIRGNDISMIFQEPMTSLNPVFTIGEQICEVLRLHQKMTRAQAKDRAIELLSLVGIPAPEKRIQECPHQLSGGMRQRVMIAMALACSPKLIIADEPTTALDVTIQGQILELMESLAKSTGTSIILITHDLGVVAETAHHVVVMYAGQVVEEAPVKELFANPLHPYTQGLMQSIPRLPAPGEELPDTYTPLGVIPGIVPALNNLPRGCRFHDRCSFAFTRCKQAAPPLATLGDAHSVRCWLHTVAERQETER